MKLLIYFENLGKETCEFGQIRKPLEKHNIMKSEIDKQATLYNALDENVWLL